MYLEAVPEGRRFLDLCRKSSKPIVVLKGGKSLKGAEAAMSHTASLAGNYKVIKGAFAQAGVIEAYDFKQMMDLCRTISLTPAVHNGDKGRIAVLTFSGGAGILTADFLEEVNLSIADLSLSSLEALQALYPPWMPVSNPVDLWPAMERFVGSDTNVCNSALEAVLSDPNVDAVIVHAFAGNIRIRIDIATAARQMTASGKPVFIWLIGRRDESFQFMQEARQCGIPVFQELYRTVECMAVAMRLSQRIPAMEIGTVPVEKAIPDNLSSLLQKNSGPLDEFLSKKVLKAHGIPVVDEGIVEDNDSISTIAAGIGYPIVMKGLRPGMIHKTEEGLVYLNIQDDEHAKKIYTTLMKKMDGQGKVLVQEQIPDGLEMIVGLLRDVQFGPSVMLGFGGTMAELFRDVEFAVAPLSMGDAMAMMERLQGKRLLDGFRGSPPVHRKELARILIALGALGMQYSSIREVDINPVIITQRGAVAVDATIILGDSPDRTMV
jgi:acetyltransferase